LAAAFWDMDLGRTCVRCVEQAWRIPVLLRPARQQSLAASSRLPVGRLVVVLNDLLPDTVEVVCRFLAKQRNEDDPSVFRFVTDRPKEFIVLLTWLWCGTDSQSRGMDDLVLLHTQNCVLALKEPVI
jgi:hypothetical protein